MDALRAVHAAGILHRDVSPDNIYISRDRVVKILDFGSNRNTTANQGRSVQVFLKHGYSPIEHEVSNLKQGAWTDVYAVAATFYRCLTGQAPSAANNRLAEDDLIRPTSMGVEMPAASEAALIKALSVMPNRRFQDIAEFQRAITPPRSAAQPAAPEPAPERKAPLPLQETGKFVSPLLPAGKARISKGAFLSSLAISGSFTSIFLLQYMASGANEAAGFALFTGIAMLITLVVFVHRIWSCIQDSKTGRSPSQALLLSLVPFGSYKGIGEFATAFNEYAGRHRSGAPKLPVGLFVVFSLIWGGAASVWALWLLFGLNWPPREWGFLLTTALVITGMFAVTRASDAINSLGGSAPARPSVRPPVGRSARPARDTGWPSIYCIDGELKGQGIEIRPEGLMIGRNPQRAQLVLTDPAVSNEHARVWCDSPRGGVWVEDRSRLGTWYLPSPNARWMRISGRVLLAPGSQFRLGEDGAIFEVKA